MCVERFHELLSDFTGKSTTRFIILNKVNYIACKSLTPNHNASPSIVIHFATTSLEYNSLVGTSMKETLAVAAKLSQLIQGD